MLQSILYLHIFCNGLKSLMRLQIKMLAHLVQRRTSPRSGLLDAENLNCFHDGGNLPWTHGIGAVLNTTGQQIGNIIIVVPSRERTSFDALHLLLLQRWEVTLVGHLGFRCLLDLLQLAQELVHMLWLCCIGRWHSRKHFSEQLLCPEVISTRHRTVPAVNKVKLCCTLITSRYWRAVRNVNARIELPVVVGSIQVQDSPNVICPLLVVVCYVVMLPGLPIRMMLMYRPQVMRRAVWKRSSSRLSSLSSP